MSTTIRSARPHDVPDITALINGFAAQQLMLPKSADTIAMALDDFVVATDAQGRVLGCAALREYSPSLAEVASVAVAEQAHGLGIGGALVRRVESLARARGTAELFALTMTAPFFQSLGYRVVDRAHFPEKVRRDCTRCPRRMACNEVCVYRPVNAAAEVAAAA
jgi:amino-acid N-acetyltransferase